MIYRREKAFDDAQSVTVESKGKLHQTEFRPQADSVGLARFGKGHVSTDSTPETPEQVYVGWTETGESLAYTVEVKESATYVLVGKFAAGGKGSKISFSFAPGLMTGLVEISLSAGTYLLRIKIEFAAGLNIDYFTFSKKP